MDSEIIYAQNIVQRIELKIAPFAIDYARFNPFEDLDSADLRVVVNESALLEFSNDKFYNILKSSDKNKIDRDIVTNFRVKCIVYLSSGKKEVLYMNIFGEFLYKGETYINEQIKEFVFEHIPNAYKSFD